MRGVPERVPGDDVPHRVAGGVTGRRRPIRGRRERRVGRAFRHEAIGAQGDGCGDLGVHLRVEAQHAPLRAGLGAQWGVVAARSQVRLEGADVGIGAAEDGGIGRGDRRPERAVPPC